MSLLKELWARFEKNCYLTTEEVQEISQRWQISEGSIRTWFKTQRLKGGLQAINEKHPGIRLEYMESLMFYTVCMYQAISNNLFVSTLQYIAKDSCK